MTKILLTECEAIIDRLAEKEYHPGDLLKTTPQIHRVLIGDVIKKLPSKKVIFEHPHGNATKLMKLWHGCGVDLPLQQILEEAEPRKLKSVDDNNKTIADWGVCITGKEAELFTYLKELRL